MTDPTIRLRGIYSTALTQLLSSVGVAVVDPSTPIEERFDMSFPDRSPTVEIADTTDRRGIGVTGLPSHVEALDPIVSEIAIDTFGLDAALPQDAIAQGYVADTRENGATVDIANTEAFLPASQQTQSVANEERITCQVYDPHPPWVTGKQPVVGMTPRVHGPFVDLVYDADGVSAPTVPLQRMVDAVAADVPTSWGITVHPIAEDVPLALLKEAVETQSKQAVSIEERWQQAAQDHSSGIVSTTHHTKWYRFGRETKFCLDVHRRAVTPTVDGHHRLKAAGEALGTAVTYLESIEAVEHTFEPAAVFETFGPLPGKRIPIMHGKPSGETFILGRGRVVESSPSDGVTVRRELSGGGRYDALDIPKESGDIARTTFVEGRWWYPTIYENADGERKGTYVNVSTPVEIHPDRISYIDLFVDVIKDKAGEVSIVDLDEVEQAEAAGLLSEELAERARSVARSIQNAL